MPPIEEASQVPQIQPQDRPRRWLDWLSRLGPNNQTEIDVEAAVCRPRQRQSLPERRPSSLSATSKTVWIEKVLVHNFLMQIIDN